MKRLIYTLLALVLFQNLTLSQKRYLVNGFGDMLPIAKGQSAAEVIRKHRIDAGTAATQACPPSQQFGNIPAQHPIGATFFFGHKEIVASWFEVTADGVIDSVFMFTPRTMFDTVAGRTALLRIHHSDFQTGHAPGWGPYLAPPHICWGYYNSSFDLDAGVAAFAEDASDPNWQSNYHNNNGSAAYPPSLAIQDHYGDLADTTLKSFPVTGDEIWGSGGIEVPFKFDSVNGYSLNLLPPRPEVAKGDPILISFSVPGANTPTGHPVGPDVVPIADPYHLILGASPDGTLGGEPPEGSPDPVDRRTFHSLKFYEHGSYCGPGWIARGGFNFQIWYSMSVISDVPPKILSVNELGSTTNELHSRTVNADVEDCNYAPGGSAGVAGVTLAYAIDGGAYVNVPMTNAGGSSWQADIPAQACGKSVSYKVTARDVNNNLTTSFVQTFQVICTRSDWFASDIGAIRTYTNALSADGGIPIDAASFFSGRQFNLPQRGNSPNKDDGTAGPFPITNGFVYFGDTLYYAWVGVNGGIALSKTATDTINVNSDGSFAQFPLPSTVRRAYPDSTTNLGTPRNFIGGLWADLIISDSDAIAGHVYHKDDPQHFIVEWDSVSVFNFDSITASNNVFRIVLNKSDGTIEFQYDHVTWGNLNTNSLVGIQSDSTNLSQLHGYFQVNLNGVPSETEPRDNWAIKLWPVTPVAIADGWNLLSVPGPSWLNQKEELLPKASSAAFTYSGSYAQSGTLTEGSGFWVKFSGAQTALIPAGLSRSASFPLVAKWNLIGSIASAVSKSSLTTTPPGLINPSAIYAYNGGYSSSETALEPGRGYWVKSSGAGTLNLTVSGAISKAQPVEDFVSMNAITIGNGEQHQSLFLAPEASLHSSPDAFEMPPAIPGGFDARFSSGRMVETYSTNGETYRIDLNSEQFPIDIHWAMKSSPAGRTFTMTDGENGKLLGKVILQGTGSVRIQNTAVKTLIIRSETGINTPKTFALSQNYPNPFNPSTRMQLEVPTTGMVTVAVFDVLGRQVAKLVDGLTESGYHSIEWNGLNADGMAMPSGTYFVWLRAGEFTAVRKLMLMR